MILIEYICITQRLEVFSRSVGCHTACTYASDRSCVTIQATAARNTYVSFDNLPRLTVERESLLSILN